MDVALVPAELSSAQDRWLVFLEHNSGANDARGHSVLCALETRGFARFGGTRALPRVEAWHITQNGLDWLEARRAADRETAL